MDTYIVLLRGVMPTGKNRVPMAQLREVLSQAGFTAVRTWIQSGNAVLRTDLAPKALEARVSELIRTHIGADLAVAVRTSTQVRQMLEGNPFTAPNDDLSRVFFVALVDEPSPEKTAALLAQDFGPERLVIGTDTAYMYIPDTYGRGKLSNNFLEKKLGVAATTRNANTLRKMVEMAEEIGG